MKKCTTDETDHLQEKKRSEKKMEKISESKPYEPKIMEMECEEFLKYLFHELNQCTGVAMSVVDVLAGEDEKVFKDRRHKDLLILLGEKVEEYNEPSGDI